MSDDMVRIIAIVAPLILCVVVYFTSRRATVTAAKAVDAVERLESKGLESNKNTEQQLETIHTLVNNQLSQAVGRFSTATAEIESLREHIKTLGSKPDH